jgi:hypothetical protein
MLNQIPEQNLVLEMNTSSTTPHELITRSLTQSVVISVNNALIRIFQFNGKQKDIYFPSGFLANEIFELESKITLTTDETNRESLVKCNEMMNLHNNSFCVEQDVRFNKLLFNLNKISFEIITKIQEFNYCDLSFNHLIRTN